MSIKNFKNITNPDQTPVDGDGISYELNGRYIATNWDWNVLMQLLKVSNASNPITKLEFRRLFPLTTLVGIDNFEFDTNILDAHKAQLRTINADFSIAESIDLQDPSIEMALDFYIALGFLTLLQKETILTNGLG